MAELLSTEARGNEGPGAIAWNIAAGSATIARSTDFAHGGSNSIKVTATGTSGIDVSVNTPYPSVVVGTAISCSIWLKNAQNHFPTLRLRFYDSGGGLLSDLTSSPSESTTVWYQASVSGTVPANAVTCRVYVQFFGWSVGQIAYLDDASVTGSTSGGTITGTIATTFGGLTATAAGVPTVKGTVSQTFGALTATASGTYIKVGAVSQPFGGLTATAAGTPTVVGSVTSTFGALTATGLGDGAVVAAPVQPLVSAPGGSNQWHRPKYPSTLRATSGTRFGPLTAAARGVVDPTLRVVRRQRRQAMEESTLRSLGIL